MISVKKEQAEKLAATAVAKKKASNTNEMKKETILNTLYNSCISSSPKKLIKRMVWSKKILDSKRNYSSPSNASS
jgi:hypothetical protein